MKNAYLKIIATADAQGGHHAVCGLLPAPESTAKSRAADMAPVPISASEADQLFTPFQKIGRLAIAVSGGADSMALLTLAAGWRQRRRQQGNHAPELVAMAVNHRLRSRSTEETRLVRRIANQLGVTPIILAWQHHALADQNGSISNLHAKARRARYRLLAEACWSAHIDALALAHHRDDQAEGILIRLCRGSGFFGLAGMAYHSRLFGLPMLRPLLDMPKARLVSTVNAAEIPYISDPSNTDDRFLRARIRALMPALADDGVSVDNILAFADQMADTRAQIETALTPFFFTAVTPHPGGYCAVDMAAMSELPAWQAYHALRYILMAVGGGLPAPPQKLQRAWHQLSTDYRDQRRSHASLAGCLMMLRHSELLIWRETGRNPIPPMSIYPGQTRLWDDRFRVRLDKKCPTSLNISVLGQRGLAIMGRKSPPIAIPKKIQCSLPAIWLSDTLVGIPHIDTWPIDRYAPYIRCEWITTPASMSQAGTLTTDNT